MPAAVRSYVATGLAVMGAGVVTVGQIVTPLQKSETRVIEAAVSLVAAVGNGQACSGYNTDGCDIWATPSYTPVAADPNGSASNIAANLINAIIGIPRAWVDGLNELSYALEVTGNWWVYSPTNVLGFDPADPPKITAMTDQVIPFKPLSHAIGNSLAWWTRANLPMNASCTGTVGPACSDIGPILSVMFKAPFSALIAGYQFPELYNPVSDAEGAIGEEIPGEVGQKVPWSGQYVKLDPSDWVTSVTNYLQADPATNAPKPITLDEIGATLDRFAKALVLAFNPWVPRSYMLKGWPYTALSPLFLPFVPVFCKTCNPDNPGGPPLVDKPEIAAAEVPPAELVSATVTEPEAPETGGGTPAVGVAPGTGKRDNGPADGPADGPKDGLGNESDNGPAGNTKAVHQAESSTDGAAGGAAESATDGAAGGAAESSTDGAGGSATTYTPASSTAAARAGFPDLAPADVADPAEPAGAPSQRVGKPHRGASTHTSVATGVKDEAGTSSARGSAADKTSE